MKTLVSSQIVILHHRTGIFISTEPIYQAIPDCYDQTGLKTTAGRSVEATGICRDLSFYVSFN